MKIARVLIVMTLLGVMTVSAQAWEGEIWLHPDAEELPTDRLGPFVRLEDGRVMTVAHNHARFSADDGQTWTEKPIYDDDREALFDPGGGALLRTSEGVIVHAFVNSAERNFAWDNEGIGPLPECQLPVYVTRSLDEGQTWEEPRKLQEGWCGYVHNMIELDSGRLVLVSQVAVPDPGHHVSFTWVSDDQGETWERSPYIDIGGKGDHAGAIEPTVVQLEDGRIWMLIRTYRGHFLESFSEDGGLTWSDPVDSGIEASGSPGILRRLDSGRILLVWNRFAEGRPKKIGRREEISIAFSEDEGETWTEPVVVARNRTPEGGDPVKHRISYPDVYEHEPGQIWITTGQGLLRMKFQESDFVE